MARSGVRAMAKFKNYHLDKYIDFEDNYGPIIEDSPEFGQILLDNKDCLEMFTRELEAKFTEKTVRKHLSNVEVYLNDFLALRLGKGPGEGCDVDNLNSFFSWMPSHLMYSGESTVKDTIAGLKRFFKLMLDKGVIEKAEYQEFLEMVKDNKEYWLEEMAQFNNVDDDSDFFFDY